MPGKEDQFGVKGTVTHPKVTTGTPPKHNPGTDNKGTKVKIHRAGK